ncbi:MAG: acetyl-CoA carboxylase biotin carboxyl carrier protein [Gemmatales bacterium]|nr:acetyl-CoA carboxylase biotin carboxyl carrier protein [Gemmatales bacterium]MDW8221635.1 acetyl-CoA carboxylase biotin carboxyl carrier protein [Gemmatales bacterium]
MPNANEGTINPFDLNTVRQLIQLMAKYELSELEWRDGKNRLKLKRKPAAAESATVAGPAAAAVPPAVAAPPAPGAPAPPTPAAEPKPAKQLHEIKSPTPGTFYAAPSPEAEPFVRVGSRVQPDTVVCMIEAMKVFNEITADCSGVIVEVCVQNQQPVEYGQVLFRVDTSA